MTGALSALIVFLKAPRPGSVKTRLAEAVGPNAAAEIYRAIAEREIRATAPAAPSDYHRVFFFAPPDASAEIAEWWPGETLRAQQGLDLGERMRRAFDVVFEDGARRAAIIGSDVPGVTRAHVLAAFRALDGADLAIGPTLDGGYYLLAMDRPRPGLFESISWSTPAVLPATIARAATLGLSVATLEGLPDVDMVDDLRSHWNDLRPSLADVPDVVAAVEEAFLGHPRGKEGVRP